MGHWWNLDMRRSALQGLGAIATTWPFLLSLLVLLINDAWLKAAWPGFVTGKLSDFAGVAIVSLLLLQVLPRHRHLAYGVVVLGFSWWKSPLSQPLIDVINRHLPVEIGRVVDYTDLAAFLVMPWCGAITEKLQAYALPGKLLRRVLLAPIVGMTVLGLMATSVIRTHQDFQVRPADQSRDLDRAAIAQAIAEVAQAHGLKCLDCAQPMLAGSYDGKHIRFRYAFMGGAAVYFKVEATPSGLIIVGSSGRENADRFKREMKARLAQVHTGLEYVEQLQ